MEIVSSNVDGTEGRLRSIVDGTEGSVISKVNVLVEGTEGKQTNMSFTEFWDHPDATEQSVSDSVTIVWK